MMSYRVIICEFLYRVLDSCGFRIPLLLLGVFKAFSTIRAPGVVTKGIFDSSPTFFSESLNSSSTWGFLNDVWELPCTLFEDFNLPFHGVLLDPLIENSCGPLINCDSCSTFDETSPFLASPSFATFSGEYQLTISSNITSLFICNFRVEGLKHLYWPTPNSLKDSNVSLSRTQRKREESGHAP